MKASAVAHPIQGLIKYHGLEDERLRLPFHDSISVCTAPLTTHTTIEFGEWDTSSAAIGEDPVTGREFERISDVVRPVLRLAGADLRFKMMSVNDFSSNIGLGASSSGFAALALASCRALGLELSDEDISRIARRGAASAARSMTGAFSRLRRGIGDEDTYSCQIGSEDLQMGIVVALVPAFKRTEDAHREAPTSPFFDSRLAEMPMMIDKMELAIRQGEVGRIGELAERDTLLLHGITMTGATEMLLWRPETMSVILKVRNMRERGIPAFFSIDTGATVYVNTFPNRVKEVRAEIEDLGVETIECRVGGAAREVKDHLF
ncbi:MAG: diphosphomevalonate decarboxylase [Candidatus Thermoplasmatota archaeon]|nr:diphosphomevalonate decarboxylase [Candidatus Thermoplasmatota archaeon]